MLNMLKLPLIATILLSSGCVAVAPGRPGYAYSPGNYYGGAYYAPPVRYYSPPPVYVAPPRVVVVRERPRWSKPERRRYNRGSSLY